MRQQGKSIISRRHRILLIVLVLLAVAIPLGWNMLFNGTNAAIRHAEAFLFRRMTVAQMAEEGRYRFFYSTNREPRASAAPGDAFSRNRVDKLRFGYFEAEVQPSLGLGMLINPTEWFQNEEIKIDEVQPADSQDFVAALREQLVRSPHRGLLVAVHGFREAFPSALRKTVFVGHVLDVDAPLLVFDWPGNQGSSPRGYLRARQVAQQSGTELAELLMMLHRRVQPDSLWLLANSLGGEVVVSAIEQLYEELDGGDKPLLKDVVLTAPDIDRQALDGQFREQLAGLADNLTVYVSSNDRALLMSRIINRSARGGESTLAPEQLEEASRIVELTSADDDLVTLVDVTPVNRTRNFHNFSLETPEFFDDLFLRLTNEQTPSSRPLHQVTTPEGRVYWVLTRGR